MFLSDDACASVPVLLDAHFPPKVRALWNAGLAGRLVCEAVQCLNRRCVCVSVPVSVSVSLLFSGTAPAASIYTIYKYTYIYIYTGLTR